MTTLLRIDASARTENSHSRKLADKYQQHWLEASHQGKVIYRDLALTPIPHLTNDLVEAFQAEDETNTYSNLSMQLIDELYQADHILISSPLYNLSVPSTLKAYFDHTVRAGKTFDVNGDEYIGKLIGKSATIITARGGLSNTNVRDDFQTEYIQEILKFVGIFDIETIGLEGTSLPNTAMDSGMQQAMNQIEGIFKPPIWKGVFSLADKAEIEKVRLAQATAIKAGEAQSYVNLCTDDIKLMLPEHDILSGIENFYQVETALFKANTFERFDKYPQQVERSGDIAVEIGKQKITMKSAESNDGIFSAEQKYMHIFRLTESGWRFSVLMSNQSNG